MGRAGARRVIEFATDARNYDSVDVIEDALRTYAAGQNADRIAVRCLRPLYRDDGSPILGERGEQRRAVLAGVLSVDRIRQVSADIAALDARLADDHRDCLDIAEARGRWHCYFHSQQVIAPITNALLPGRSGTITSAGIGAYTTIAADLDPEPTAAPGDAVVIADELATALSRIDRRIDRRALLIQQSGRGAYVLLNIEPQPLTVRSVIRDTIRTLARLVRSVGAAVQVDPSVHDPARILRIAGTTNHKPGADPCTPAWILRAWTPTVRIPWAAIERLAAPSRPKLRVIEGRTCGSSSARRPLRDLFAARGWIFAERSDGTYDVRCPQADLHSDGRDAAILYPPREPGGPGWVKCLHAHCDSLTLSDVYRRLGET
jgi:hypothetical protein